MSQLRGFLGLSGYYHWFVKHYAQIFAPLTQLLCKNSFIWTAEAKQAFTLLKKAFTTILVLALPNFSQPFVVQTDTFGHSVGVILLQDGHPVAYFSKQICLKLEGTSTYMKELYAVMEAVKKWQQYLLGTNFVIRTDHQPLKALLTQPIHTIDQ